MHAGCFAGQIGAIIVWLVTCAATEGDINVDNLGADYPMLAGNVTALGLSLIVTTALSFAMPQNFDWEVMKNGIKMIEQDGTDKLAKEGEDSEDALRDALKYALFLMFSAPNWGFGLFSLGLVFSDWHGTDTLT